MIRNSVFTIQRLHGYIFYVLLILLPTQLGLHFWPGWALVMGRRIDYLSPTLYATDILIFFIILFWSTAFIYRIVNSESGIRNKIKKTFSSQFTIQYSVFIALIIFIFLNIYLAANRMVAIFAWIKIIEMIALGIYIVRTKPGLSSIVFPLSIGILYSSVIAISQFLLQRSIGGPVWFLGERTFSAFTPGIARIDFNYSLFTIHNSLFKLRSYATFPHPNVLGGYLAVLLPVILQYATTPMHTLSRTKTIFYFVTFILGMIALVVTFSRSAWAVGGIAIIIAIARIRNRELRILNNIYIRMGVVLMGLIILQYSLFRILNSKDESVVVRQQLNTAAFSLFRASPLIGNGLGNFIVRLPDYLVSRSIYFLQPVHNIYLLILSETGIIGLLFVLWILWKALNNESGILNSEFRKTKNHSIFRIQYSVFAILLLGLVDHYPLTLQQGQLLFTVLLSASLIQ